MVEQCQLVKQGVVGRFQCDVQVCQCWFIQQMVQMMGGGDGGGSDIGGVVGYFFGYWDC